MKTLLNKVLRVVHGEYAYRAHKPQRVLFDHLPKCAGTTVTEYLLMHYSRPHIFRTDGSRPDESVYEFRSLPQSARYRYHLIIGHLANELMDYVHPDTITLTTFRDPVDRIISHYFFVKQNKKHYLHKAVVGSNMQLEDYATSMLSPELRNWYTTHFTGLSIDDVEQDPEGAVRFAADAIAERYDIVGFQDTLPSVMRQLRTSAGLLKPFANKVQNKTTRRPGFAEVPASVRKTIADINFVDVMLYDLLKEREGRNTDSTEVRFAELQYAG